MPVVLLAGWALHFPAAAATRTAVPGVAAHVDSPPSPTPSTHNDAAYGDLVMTPPRRLADTRADGTPLRSGQTLVVDVAGRLGVPAGDVNGVFLNVTTVPVQPGGGHLVVNDGQPTESSSAVYRSGAEARFVLSPVDDSGRVHVRAVGAATHVVVDARSYLARTAADDSRGIASAEALGRVADTRRVGGPMRAGETRTFTLPETEAAEPGRPVAALLVAHVLPAGATSGGYFSAGTDRSVSDLNASPREARTNTVLVPVQPDGSFSVYAERGGYHLVLDGAILYRSGGRFAYAARAQLLERSERRLDTRTTNGGHFGPVRGGERVLVDATGTTLQRTRPVLAVVTVLPTSSQTGYVRAGHPTSARQVTALQLVGRPVSNALPLWPDSEGRILLNPTAGTHAIVDVIGSL